MASKNKSKQKNQFIFKKHTNIGAADAIEDMEFLNHSFVDRGELNILKDNVKPQCVILGRTGTGKTALLEHLANTEEHVISIDPENLAITHISNNEILKFFMIAGVNMDLFFRLLWRHVFAIEIIKERFQIVNEERQDNFFRQMLDLLRKNRQKQEAMKYLREWGDSFWKETDYRVKEITEKLEEDLSSSAQASLSGILPFGSDVGASLNANAAKKLTEEQKSEVIRHGQQVVDRVQIRRLSEVIDILEQDILDKKFEKYFITIDKLDENWVNEEFRYQLIRALLETIREFNNKLSSVKIIIAVREDLLDRVFKYTRSPGYQEEKYQSMYLNLTWTEKELEELLNKRISQLIRDKYTKSAATSKSILPNRVNKQNGLTYFLSRTLLRPRDAIMFFNECITAGENKASFNQSTVLQAEVNYSHARLRAIGDEWSADYINLLELALFLRGFPPQFLLLEKSDKFLELMLDFLIKMEHAPSEKKGEIFYLIQRYFNDGRIEMFAEELFNILFRVGILGIKPQSSKPVWSFQGHNKLKPNFQVDKVVIHPAFYKVLSVSNH